MPGNAHFWQADRSDIVLLEYPDESFDIRKFISDFSTVNEVEDKALFDTVAYTRAKVKKKQLLETVARRLAKVKA